MELPQNIWMYWENLPGQAKPEYLDLCLETVYRNKGNLKVNVLNSKIVQEILPNIPPNWHKLKRIAHKADYARARVVYEYGGIWLDSDVIVTGNLEQTLEPLKEHDFVGTGREYGKPHIFFFAARKKSNVLKQWIDLLDKELLDKSEFKWTNLGADLLWPILEKTPYHHYSFDRFAPFLWTETERYFSETEPHEDFKEKDMILFSLWNEMNGLDIKQMSKNDILKSNMFISRLFRWQLGKQEWIGAA